MNDIERILKGPPLAADGPRAARGAAKDPGEKRTWHITPWKCFAISVLVQLQTAVPALAAWPQDS